MMFEERSSPTVKRWLFAFVGALLSCTASAVEVGNFDEIKGSEYFRAYIEGVGHGFLWANAELQVNKRQTLLFCVPPSLGLTTDNYVGLIEAEIRDSKANGGINGKAPVELVLMGALKKTFPCRK